MRRQEERHKLGFFPHHQDWPSEVIWMEITTQTPGHQITLWQVSRQGKKETAQGTEKARTRGHPVWMQETKITVTQRVHVATCGHYP